MPKNDLPLYFEELKIKEDSALTLSDLLAQIKQQIPVNYLEINLEEGNYEIQLDLPHSLMDKLGLKKGEDIIQPLYLDPQVLTRTETYKGITLQEGEIILVNPHKITLKDQAIQTDLIQTRINSLNSQINQKNTQINTLQTNYNNADNRANNLQTQLTTANAELVREKDSPRAEVLKELLKARKDKLKEFHLEKGLDELILEIRYLENNGDATKECDLETKAENPLYIKGLVGAIKPLPIVGTLDQLILENLGRRGEEHYLVKNGEDDLLEGLDLKDKLEEYLKHFKAKDLILVLDDEEKKLETSIQEELDKNTPETDQVKALFDKIKGKADFLTELPTISGETSLNTLTAMKKKEKTQMKRRIAKALGKTKETDLPDNDIPENLVKVETGELTVDMTKNYNASLQEITTKKPEDPEKETKKLSFLRLDNPKMYATGALAIGLVGVVIF
ncbi:2066_t:CDS:2 [Funneliformis geosporum]|nr:2066_t:CDS:2 [Funneliformis geosporum]